MADEYSYPYTPPPFLQGQSADQIHSRMLENLPADIDKSQGNIPWDFTRPSALEKAEFEEGCKKALKQIDDRNYQELLLDDGMTKIRKYGIACYKKRCRVISG